MNRRHFLNFITASSALEGLTRAGLGQETGVAPVAESLPPTRALTLGSKFHWFAYYDKLQFDPTDRYILSNQVDFEGRTPGPDDVLRVGMIDTADGDKWTELGTSTAWGWQQGCMLQWLPGSQSKIIWNDRDKATQRYVSHILDVKTGEKRTLPLPVYTISPDGKWAVTPDFARIDYCRSGYGYSGIPDPCSNEKAPAKSGIWRMNLETGEHQLIFSIADAVAVPHPELDLTQLWNWFNHLLISPDGKRLIFLHRWRERVDIPREQKAGGFKTRMFTVNLDGTEPYVLEPSGVVSHFIWRDPEHLVAWAKPTAEPEARVIVYKDKTREYTKLGADKITVDGHMTYLPHRNNEWLLCDTYPDPVRRLQTPFLYHIPTDRRIPLGHFFEPREYKGEYRCDTHPRSSNDGKKVVIDSVHAGNGRQMYLIDVSGIH
ncbi:hypothetical protein [Verrucomicrobium spinosum]|uniref:hypothetical protein n=1 Tax=Verrucomicrobium spinosum TaxID=2736 RepID=UPI0001744428|nr:hypothetical protein [Verrucomicrobium spinosum]